MIKATIYRNNENDIYGFEVKDHADPIVCSAVSLMVLNTANSFEIFIPNVKFNLEYDDDGGYFNFEVPSVKSGTHNHDADLLLKSFELALEGIEYDYEKEIKVIHKGGNCNVKN